jgi:HK97 family phage major capsid protein
MNIRELRAKRWSLLDKAKSVLDRSIKENRDNTPGENAEVEQLMRDAGNLEMEIRKLEILPSDLPDSVRDGNAPAYLRTGRGDSEERAMSHYFRTGDEGGIAGSPLWDRGSKEAIIQLPSAQEMRAVDSTMNITTAADGGATVPTGFARQIAARRNEIRIDNRIGVRKVPGSGTTVDFPFENADPSVFATTAEQSDAHGNNYQRDAAVFDKKSFTLVKKTKKLELTEELLQDEDASLMSFIADFIGRGMGLTLNAMLIAEVVANATAAKTFASASAIANGEIEDLVYGDTISYYLDDGGAISWIMRPSTYGRIKKLSGDPRTYGNFQSGAKDLLEYPVAFSNSVAAVGASAKSVIFGNFYFLGMREDGGLRFIRDPYSVDGMVVLKYSFRAVYGILVAGGICYATHPTA